MPIQTAADSISNSQGSPFGFKNRIINGAMVIDQRNAGASITPTTLYSTYGLDRWATVYGTASKFSVQQVSTAPAEFTYSQKITSAGAYSVPSGEIYTLNQYVEGYNIADLAWGTSSAKTVTLSFWVYSSLTGTFGGAINNGDTNNRAYPFSYTISAANTWERKTITIPGDTTGTWTTTNASALTLRFGLGVGSTYSGTANIWQAGVYYAPTGSTNILGTSGATWYVTGVQLEKGSQATAFDYRDYGNELRLCQRYFQRFGGNSTYETFAIGQAYNTTNAWCMVPTKVNMRATPTFAPTSGANLQLMNSSGTGLNCSGGCDIGYGSNTFVDLFPTVSSGLTAGNASVFRSAGTTSGFISFSAEL
jgi:hypothetical protein